MSKKIALILPCNRGALEGNYFLGKYWQTANKSRDPRRISLGAIDCIPVLKKNEDDAIVMEWEMERVKGYDVYPQYNERNISKIAAGIVNGLIRIAQIFDKIIIMLNVKLYAEATRRALSQLPKEIREKIEFIYIPGKPGLFTKKIREKIAELQK